MGRNNMSNREIFLYAIHAPPLLQITKYCSKTIFAFYLLANNEILWEYKTSIILLDKKFVNVGNLPTLCLKTLLVLCFKQSITLKTSMRLILKGLSNKVYIFYCALTAVDSTPAPLHTSRELRYVSPTHKPRTKLCISIEINIFKLNLLILLWTAKYFMCVWLIIHTNPTIHHAVSVDCKVCFYLL